LFESVRAILFWGGGQLSKLYITILGWSGGHAPPKRIEFGVSEMAFLALWRYLEKNVKVLIDHLLTMSNTDFRILDNLILWET
jgi:hypothetical protein